MGLAGTKLLGLMQYALEQQVRHDVRSTENPAPANMPSHEVVIDANQKAD